MRGKEGDRERPVIRTKQKSNLIKYNLAWKTTAILGTWNYEKINCVCEMSHFLSSAIYMWLPIFSADSYLGLLPLNSHQ